jgi:hypothetical protein
LLHLTAYNGIARSKTLVAKQQLALIPDNGHYSLDHRVHEARFEGENGGNDGRRGRVETKTS